MKNLLKFMDATAGAFVCLLMRLSPAAVNRAGGGAPIDKKKLRRILVVRPGGMGDMVLLWPVIKILQKRFPEADIEIICEKRNMEVLRIAGFRGRVMTYDSAPFVLLARLLRGGYDVALDTEQFHHFSAVFAFLSGAPVRAGFKINPRRNPLYTQLVDYSLDGNEGEQFMKIAAGLLGDGDEYVLEESIDGSGLDLPEKVRSVTADTRRYAVIQPGASTSYKLWPAERYQELAKNLYEIHGMDVFLVGDSGDAGVCSAAAAGVPEGCRCLSLAGELDLALTAGLIRDSAVFIGPDSGLAHLAAALGVPTVVLFGPSDCRKWGIVNGRHAVVRKDLPCAPCFMFGYSKPCNSFECMRQIEVPDVIDAVARVIKQ